MRDLKLSSWVIWSLTVFFFAYQFVLRLSPGALYEEIMLKFQIDATTFAIMSGFYYLGYAGMQVPIGMLLDKLGVKFVVSTCAIICVIGNLPFIYSDSWEIALFGRFLIGLGSAAGALGAIKAVRMSFSHDNVSKMIGWTVTIGLLGAINGKKINNLLIDNFGWQNAIIYLSIPGVILAVLILLFVKHEKNDHQETVEGSIFDALIQVIKNSQIVLLSIFGALLVGPLEAFADVWGSPFFEKVFGYSKDEAGYLSGAATYFGMCVGSPLLAWIADKYQCHYNINIFAGLIMAILYIAMIFKITEDYYVLFAINFIIGIMCAYQVIVFATVTDIVPANLSGIAISFVNMINMAAGYLFNYAFGKVIHLSWNSSTLVNNLPVYHAKDYTNSIYILPITLIIGAIGFWYLMLKAKKA